MSFALRSPATARLILDASLLHCTRVAINTIFKFADQSFCWMRNSVFSFLFAIYSLLNAAVFADLALYLAVGGLARWSFLSLLPLSCFTHIWHRFLGCLSLLCGAVRALCLFLSSSSPVGSRFRNIVPGDCAAVCSRSASLHPATELRSARGRASVCWTLAASHRLGHLCLPLHLWSHCSFPRDPALSLKLFDITSTRSFQGVRISPGTFSLAEL